LIEQLLRRLDGRIVFFATHLSGLEQKLGIGDKLVVAFLCSEGRIDCCLDALERLGELLRLVRDGVDSRLSPSTTSLNTRRVNAYVDVKIVVLVSHQLNIPPGPAIFSNSFKSPPVDLPDDDFFFLGFMSPR
jgi:hypothetical protein